MHFYRITETDCTGPVHAANQYRCIQSEAHAYAKTLAKDKWRDARIELVDVITDKAAICTLLNHYDEEHDHEVLRTWKLSARGALVECKNGE